MTTKKYITIYLVTLFTEFVFLMPTFMRGEREILILREMLRDRFILQKILVYLWIHTRLQ